MPGPSHVWLACGGAPRDIPETVDGQSPEVPGNLKRRHIGGAPADILAFAARFRLHPRKAGRRQRARRDWDRRVAPIRHLLPFFARSTDVQRTQMVRNKAAQLVASHAGEWDGNRYEYLTLAADALETKYPLAAIILRRAMIDYTLKNARSKRYRHAARHLLECESLASVIADFGTIAPHEAYVSALKAQHGRKAAFWEHAT